MLIRKILVVGTLLCISLSTFGQTVCDPADVVGSNLITNGDFESGDVGFTTDIAYSWNASGAPGACYSNSGEYYIGTSPQDFVGGCQFQSGWGYTAYEGSNYMMVDGAESPGDIVWAQTVSGIEANTYYYFSMAVTSLSSGNLAQLKFEIDGVIQDTTLDAPATPGDWIVYNQIWYSGATTGSIDLEITDIRAGCGGCPDNNDYGLDALIFEKGCPTDAFDDQPELGPDATLCGTNGTITLDPGVVNDIDNFIYWSTGINDDDETIDVVSPGTYYVCVTETGTCTKIDSINVSDDYEIELGNDFELCSPSGALLDAGHSGINVTYQWYKDDVAIGTATSQTYYVNASGEYKVEVSDPSCDDKADSLDVTVSTYLPNVSNIEYCVESNPDTTLTFDVTPSGTMYDWYDTDVILSPLAGGSGTDSFTRSGITNDGDTLWVKNNTYAEYPSTGPNSATATNNGGGMTIAGYSRTFDALSNLVIDSVEMKGGPTWGTGPCNGIAAGNPCALFDIYLYQGGTEIDTVKDVQVYAQIVSYVTLNLTVPMGTDYQLRPSSGGNGGFFISDNNAGYSITDVIDIPSNAGKSFPEDRSGAFFNWAIRAENQCDRVPVFAINNCPLPVDFAFFSVKNKGSYALLGWATTYEENNSHFEILKSTDGYNFEVIGVVNGAGNSNELLVYEFTDHNIGQGTSYYKIRQIDYDGLYDYSDVQSITKEGDLGINVYPNPFNASTTLSIASSSDEELHLSIYDIYGIEIYSAIVEPNEEITLGKNYSSGLYIINVYSESETKTLKIIKN